MRNFLRDLQKIRKDPKRLMRALGILWTRVWFLLIPMGVLVLLRSENRISDMILLVMVVALFLIATEPKSKKSKKYVFILLFIKNNVRISIEAFQQ